MSLPVIDWATLTDDELMELLLQAQAEEHRRWETRRPRSFVDDLRAGLARDAQEELGRVTHGDVPPEGSIL